MLDPARALTLKARLRPDATPRCPAAHQYLPAWPVQPPVNRCRAAPRSLRVQTSVIPPARPRAKSTKAVAKPHSATSHHRPHWTTLASAATPAAARPLTVQLPTFSRQFSSRPTETIAREHTAAFRFSTWRAESPGI